MRVYYEKIGEKMGLHNNRAVIFVKKLVSIYFGKRVSRSAAELSYFLTLSVFPMLICLYALLGNLLPNSGTLLNIAREFLPGAAVDIFTDYIGYISSHTSTAMLTGGLILMATTSAAAFRCLHNIMGDIQGQVRFTGVFSLIFSFLFSLVFLAVIYFSVIVLLTGNWLMTYLSEHLDFMQAAESWTWVRFLLLFLLLLVIIYGLYRILAPKGTEGTLAPGSLAAALALVGVSVLFSWFIGLSARYPLVYGSLASIIILMFWLFICGNILIMGNAVNVVLRDMRGKSAGAHPCRGGRKS